MYKLTILFPNLHFKLNMAVFFFSRFWNENSQIWNLSKTWRALCLLGKTSANHSPPYKVFYLPMITIMPHYHDYCLAEMLRSIYLITVFFFTLPPVYHWVCAGYKIFELILLGPNRDSWFVQTHNANHRVVNSSTYDKI